MIIARKAARSGKIGRMGQPRLTRLTQAAAGFMILAAPVAASAGMPSFRLTDIAEARIQTISFFLLLFFLAALAVMGLWNVLRRDFVRLPRLTFRKSLVLTGVWGLLFILVLTMISGARELMTPGAWVKDGVTYKLKKSGDDGGVALKVWQDASAQRRTRLETLRAALLAYAQQHNGTFPPDERAPEISAATWETADLSRARFGYVPGLCTTAPPSALIAYEPPISATGHLVLFVDGRIEELSAASLRIALAQTQTAASARKER